MLGHDTLEVTIAIFGRGDLPATGSNNDYTMFQLTGGAIFVTHEGSELANIAAHFDHFRFEHHGDTRFGTYFVDNILQHLLWIAAIEAYFYMA